MTVGLKDINVLLTGFAPFSDYAVNPSWESVKLLRDSGLGEMYEHVKLHCHELPVLYNVVKDQLPALWQSVKPDLTVHVGVSGEAREITLEQQAHNGEYKKIDCEDCLPPDSCCVPGGDQSICSGLKMGEVCEYIITNDQGIKAVVSTDAGRFLCDFSYYTSLSIDRAKSAFIHIPPVDKPYTLQQLASGIRLAIIAMLIQLKLLP